MKFISPTYIICHCEDESKFMKYLITGSAGFIGSALTRKIISMGADVVSVDNLNNYYSPKLKNRRLNEFGIRKNSRFIEMDLCNRNQIHDLIKEYKPNQVIHLAAQAGVRFPVTQNHKYLTNNIIGFENVISAVLENEIESFIYASSSSVYGNTANLPYAEEEQNLKPESFYGYTKLTNEQMIKYYFKKSNTKVRGLRFFTVYGPWGRPDMAYLRLCSKLIRDTQFSLFGDGTIKRDFTYIDDVIVSVVKLSKELISRNSQFQDIVNIGGGNPISINEMIKIASNLCGRKIEITKEAGNVLDVKETLASTRYLESLINFVPQTTISDGMNKVLNWIEESTTNEELQDWVASCP